MHSYEKAGQQLVEQLVGSIYGGRALTGLKSHFLCGSGTLVPPIDQYTKQILGVVISCPIPISSASALTSRRAILDRTLQLALRLLLHHNFSLIQ